MKFSHRFSIVLSFGIAAFGFVLFIAIVTQPHAQPVDFSKMSFEEIRAFHEGTGAQVVSAGIVPGNVLYVGDRAGEWLLVNVIVRDPVKKLERVTLLSQEKVAEMVAVDASSYAAINVELSADLDLMAQLFGMEEIDTTEQGQNTRSYALRALRSEQDQLLIIAQNNSNEIILAAITKIVNVQEAGRQFETSNASE